MTSVDPTRPLPSAQRPSRACPGGSRRTAPLLVSLLLLAALLLAACGGGNAPSTSPQTSSDIIAGGAVTAVPTSAPTVAPTAVPTPALPSIPPYPTDANTPLTRVPAYRYEILATYPHAPEAYTQGLQYVDGQLFEGTGLTGRSSLRRVELETGAIQQQHNLAPDLFGEGIVVIGERIYQITWQNQVAFLYDRDTFEELQQWTYDTEGWGLTFDGSQLIMSDGSTRLFFRNPADFAETGQREVTYLGQPINRINELEYINLPAIGPEVWANIYTTDAIIRIDPTTGQVRSVVDLSGILTGVPGSETAEVLNGIAYDAANDRLFITGKLWPVLFQIRLVHAGWMQLTP